MQSPLFHPARTNPQAIAIKENYFHPVPSFVSEKEQMAGSGILLELAHDKSIEAIKAQPHICRPGCHENARSRAQP